MLELLNREIYLISHTYCNVTKYIAVRTYLRIWLQVKG